jgi:hypothetical protein
VKVQYLLTLIAKLDDTNLLHGGGAEGVELRNGMLCIVPIGKRPKPFVSLIAALLMSNVRACVELRCKRCADRGRCVRKITAVKDLAGAGERQQAWEGCWTRGECGVEEETLEPLQQEIRRTCVRLGLHSTGSETTEIAAAPVGGIILKTRAVLAQ